MSEKYEVYLLSYPYNGEKWSAQIMATSVEDANARRRALGAYGKVDGVLHEVIPAAKGLGWLARLYVSARVWWLNGNRRP